MPRINGDTGVRGPSAPQARIVDAFEVAPPPEKINIGSALMNTFGIIRKEVAEAQAKKEKADRRKGELEGLKLSAEQDGAKIRQGMYPNASPAYMAGLRESLGQADAWKTTTQWKADYNQFIQEHPEADIKPEIFQEWIGQKLNDATGRYAGDEFATAGALPVLRMQFSNLMQQHAAAAADRVEKRELVAFEHIIAGKAGAHDWSEDPTGRELIGAIAYEADVRVAKGLDGTTVNDTVVSSMIHMAQASNDPKYLLALLNANDDGTYKLNAQQLAAVEATEDSVSAELTADESARERRRKAALEKAEDDYTRSFLDTLVSNPEILPDPRNAPSPDAYKAALDLRRVHLKTVRETDPIAEQENLIQLLSFAYSPETRRLPFSQKSQALARFIQESGQEYSDATLGRLFSQIGRTEDPSAAVNDETVKSQFKIAAGWLKGALMKDFMPADDIAPLSTEFEAFFGQYLSQFERSNGTLEGMSIRERRELADEAIRYAAEQALLSRQDDAYLDDTSEQVVRFLKRIGVDPARLQETTEQEVSSAGDKLSASMPEETEPTDAPEEPVIEVPEQAKVDTPAEPAPQTDPVIEENWARNMDNMSEKRRGFEQAVFGMDLTGWVKEQVDALISYVTSTDEDGGEPTLSEFRKRNEAMQERIKQKYPQNMEKVRDLSKRIEEAVFGQE